MGMDESVCERRTRVLFNALGGHEHRRMDEETLIELKGIVKNGKNIVASFHISISIRTSWLINCSQKSKLVGKFYNLTPALVSSKIKNYHCTLNFQT